MFKKILAHLFPSKYMATFEISNALRSVLPVGFEHFAGQLHLLRRSNFPLFSERQICELVRITQQTGDGYMLDRLASNLVVRLDGVRDVNQDQREWTYAKPRVQATPDILQEHLKLAYFNKEALRSYADLEQYYELVDLAHTWMEWKARAVLWSEHVSRDVVVRSHWNFVSYLLLMDHPPPVSTD